MKKTFVLLLCILMLCFHIQGINAATKSIYALGSDQQIDNASSGVDVLINGKKGIIYYGKNGINICFDDEVKHLDTVFNVLKLIVTDDVNNDGYPELLTYQAATEFTDQLFLIDGNTGEIIKSTNLTKEDYNKTLGKVYTNTSVLYMNFYNGNIYLISDYSIICYDNMLNEVARYSDNDNIWDFVIYNQKIYAIDQLGNLIVLDLYLNEEEKIAITEPLLVQSYWNEEITYNVIMNLWDIELVDNTLYLTSEDGFLYSVDPTTLEINSLSLGVLDRDKLPSYYNSNYDMVKDKPVLGRNTPEFKAFKIIDSYADYLLVACNFVDEDCYSTYPGSFLPYFVLVNKAQMSVETTIDYSNYNSNGDGLIWQKDGETVILTIYPTGGNEINISLFDLSGKLLQNYQRSAGVSGDGLINITRDENKVRVEGYGSGAYLLDENLDTISAIYDKVTLSMIGQIDESYIVGFNVNGELTKIVSYQNDLQSINWQYELDSTESRGLKGVKLLDYNNDGTNDVLATYTIYNSKNEPTYTNLLILSGSDGSILLNNRIALGYQYDEKGKKYMAYLITEEFSLIKDIFGDGKKEIVANNYIINSKTLKLESYISTYVEDEGNMLEIGDCNGDMIQDFLMVSDKKATLYVSNATKNGVTFKKSASTSLNTAGYNSYKAVVLGDINNDGVSEVVFNNFNQNKYQVFDVYDGKTLKKLYTICPNGTSDYEQYKVLDFDLNNDGYNEVYGYSDIVGTQLLMDGKTGEIIKWFNTYDFEDIDIEENSTDYYHPDYLVDFQIIEESPIISEYADVNNDGYKEYAITKTIWNYSTYKHSDYLCIYDGKTNELMETTKFGTTEMYSSYNIKKAEGGNGTYYFICSDYVDTVYLYDQQKKSITRTYNVKANKFAMLDEKTVLLAGEKNVYIASVEESFKLKTEIPEVTNDYILNLKWEQQTAYSTMSIYDNDNLVYTGSDNECTIKLLEGDHVIRFALSDTQGCRAEESYKINVSHQTNNKKWIVLVSGAIMFVLAVFVNTHRKLRVKKELKGVL